MTALVAFAIPFFLLLTWRHLGTILVRLVSWAKSLVRSKPGARRRTITPEELAIISGIIGYLSRVKFLYKKFFSQQFEHV